MHDYYGKERGKLRRTMKGFLALVSTEPEAIGEKPYGTIFESIWRIYERDMLERFPYIGGDKASGTKNLTEAYMPYLCNLDYVMFGIVGAPLFREHTCMEEGSCCDFKLKVAAKPMPYWPPVFSQGKGYK